MTDRLARMKEGLVCLVPKDGKGGITCHEKSVCDCTVIELIELVEEAKDIIYNYNTMINTRIPTPVPAWLSKLSEFQNEGVSV